MKKALALILVLVMVFAFVGCAASTDIGDNEATTGKQEGAQTIEPGSDPNAGKDEAGDDEIVLAYLPKTLQNDYYYGMYEAIEEKCNEYGWKMQTGAPDSETNVDQQMAYLESFIEAKVDVMLLVPCDSVAMGDTITRATEEGIIVFLVDTDSTSGEYIAFIGTDNYSGGVEEGKWIGENLKEGEVAIEDGFVGNDSCTNRFNGMTDIFASDYPGINVVTSEYGNCEMAKGMDVAENFLTAYPNLACIACVNDQMAIGAASAVTNSGRADSVIVVGFDGNPDASQAILDGTPLVATIAQAPATMGRRGVEFAKAYMDGEYEGAYLETGEKDIFYIAPIVVTKDNAADYLVWK